MPPLARQPPCVPQSLNRLALLVNVPGLASTKRSTIALVARVLALALAATSTVALIPANASATNVIWTGSVAAGWNNTCAISNSKKAWCWGANDHGQLGDGTRTQRTSPVRAGSLTGVPSIDTGGSGTSCAIHGNGYLSCWGANESGQAGTSPFTDVLRPTRISVGKRVSQVSIGWSHTCALTEEGRAWCWGRNDHAELGTGAASKPRSKAVEVKGITSAIQIGAGREHACVLLSGGGVRCWGSNVAGDLGNGSSVDSASPVRVLLPLTATRISVEEHHACALLTDKTVRCWGYAGNGELGNGVIADVTGTPVAVSGVANASAVSIGHGDTCVIAQPAITQFVECLGRNWAGILGGGVTGPSLTMLPIGGVLGAVSVSVGGNHACAAGLGSPLICWGDNMRGQIGIGSTNPTSTLRLIRLP